MWSGTLDGVGTPENAKNGLIVQFKDCNHVSDTITYAGYSAGDEVWDYLYNPPPGGGVSAKVITTVVATSNTSAVVISASGTTATLHSQSTINYLTPEGKVAKTVTSAPGTISFGAQVIPAGDIHQLINCGTNSANFCGLGKNQLTVFSSTGVATKRYSLPEDANFAVANSAGEIYVFATNTGHLYNLDANGSATLLDGFASTKVIAAAINGNEIATITSAGELQRFDTSTNVRIGTYTVPADQNNIVYSRDGSTLVGKLGSVELNVLDRSGALHQYVLSAALKTLVQQDQSDALASLATGDVIRVDSLGNATTVAHAAKPEDLNAGFHIQGRTLVLSHRVDVQ
jgi:hypothetical protein